MNDLQTFKAPEKRSFYSRYKYLILLLLAFIIFYSGCLWWIGIDLFNLLNLFNNYVVLGFIAVVLLVTRKFFWTVLIFFFGIVSLFTTIALVIHSEILYAVLMLVSTGVCFGLLGAIDD